MSLSANFLTLGCDCRGEIFAFDGTLNDSVGRPRHDDPQRGLHARSGLRHRVEAHRLPHPGSRGPPQPALNISVICTAQGFVANAIVVDGPS